MDQPLEKSSAKPPEVVKKPESQKLQAPSGFAEELSKYPSAMEGILKFLCHPFILLGGIMVAIYFLYKAKQSGSKESDNAKLLDINEELRTEVKALREENRNFKAQLGLSNDDGYDYSARERKLLTVGKKKISVARLE